MLPQRYKKDGEESFALGPFPSFELLDSRPEQAVRVYAAGNFREKEKLAARCRALGVPFEENEKALARLSQKEVLYAAAQFRKYGGRLGQDRPHVVLVDPADMGNLGTIQRSMLAFGITDLAIVGQRAADHFNPKAVRASMGAVFRLEVERFSDFAGYLARYGAGRELFPFMLDGGRVLTPDTVPESPCYSLIFGNEAAGLPPEFQGVGPSLFIPQSEAVDSLNLAVSAALGIFLFTQKNGGRQTQ